MATMVSGGEWGYEASRDFIDVTSGAPVADPNWVGTCPNGHPHAYRTIETTAPGRCGETYWCEMCRDDHADWLGWFCAKCGERVEVGTLPPFTRQSIPGRISLSVWVLRYDGARLTYSAPGSFLDWLKDHKQATTKGEQVLAELERCGAVLTSVEGDAR